MIRLWRDDEPREQKGRELNAPCLEALRSAYTEETRQAAPDGARARSVFCVGLQKFAVFEAARSRSYAKF